MSLEKVGIYGIGNVGAALVMELARDANAAQIDVASRNPHRAQAAILDATSAFPERTEHFLALENLEGAYDVVVVTAGEQPKPAVTPAELLARNLKLAARTLSEVECGVAVVIGTPVDLLTEQLARVSSLSVKQLIGFGGELDRARIIASLVKRGIETIEPVYAIGEHGPRVVPVYAEERDYQAVKDEARSVLATIKRATGTARNLATGIQLGRLLNALSGQEHLMCISRPNENYEGLSITWPHMISEAGVGDPVPLELGASASEDLEQLLIDRRTIV
jgi:malate/lactate dehydrogenase